MINSKKLETLLQNATPGRWTWKMRKNRSSLHVRHRISIMKKRAGCLGSYTSILETGRAGDWNAESYAPERADRELIAMAPRLAREVLRLRARLEELEELDQIMDGRADPVGTNAIIAMIVASNP